MYPSSESTQDYNSDASTGTDQAPMQDGSVLDRAEALVRTGELGEAQSLINEELAKSQQDKTLLLLLARIEYENGHNVTAVRYAADAAHLKPADATVVAGYANLLAEIGYFRKVEHVLTRLDTEIYTHPLIRTALGDLYWRQGWYAKAVAAYGSPHDLPAHARRRKRNWYIGVPISYLRNRVREANEYEERTWHVWTDRPALAKIFRPLGPQGDLLQAEVDHLNLRWIRITFSGWWGDTAGQWARRSAVLVMTAIVWIGLLTFLHVTQPGTYPWSVGSVWALLGTLMAYAGWQAIDWYAGRAISHRGARIRWIISTIFFSLIGSVIALTGVAALDGRDLRLAPIGIGLATAPILAVLAYGAPLVVRSWALGDLKELRARMPRAAILDALGDLIEEISDSGNRNSLQMRAKWIDILEDAASVLDKFLPDYLVPPTTAAQDPITREQVCRWAAGAAASLRRLKQEVVEPHQETWDKVLSALRRQAEVMARGDFGSLETLSVPQPVSVSESKPLWKGLAVLRIILVAVLPIAVALLLIALQSVVSISSDIVRWATVAGVVWLIYTVLFYLDPALRQKAEIARGIPVGLVPTVGKSAQSPGQAGS